MSLDEKKYILETIFVWLLFASYFSQLCHNYPKNTYTRTYNDPNKHPHGHKPTMTPLPFIKRGEFPIGTFESVNKVIAVEFYEDGTCHWHSQSEGWEVPCKYGVNGDLFTEMTFEWPTGLQVPATYYWTFDGENLSFHLYGKDLRPHRKQVYDGQTYLFTGEKDVSPKVEGIEFPTGKFMLDSCRFYAIEFNEDGTWDAYETDDDVPSVSGNYATNGNLYTEMTNSHSDYHQIPATYYWVFDGENLTFKLWGEDVNPDREALFDDQTYLKVEESSNPH